ncbi:MAG: hypothetical protein WEE51_09360 [Pirellulaceae bacterium]
MGKKSRLPSMIPVLPADGVARDSPFYSPGAPEGINPAAQGWQ